MGESEIKLLSILGIIVLILMGVCTLLVLICKHQDKKQKEEDNKWVEYIKSRGTITYIRYKTGSGDLGALNNHWLYVYVEDEKHPGYPRHSESHLYKEYVNEMEDELAVWFKISNFEIVNKNTIKVNAFRESANDKYDKTCFKLIEKGQHNVTHLELTFEDNTKLVMF